MARKSKKSLSPTLGLGVDAPPYSPVGEFAKHERRMKHFVTTKSDGAHAYIPHTAMPRGNGEWSYWTRPVGGGKPREERASHAHIERLKYES